MMFFQEGGGDFPLPFHLVNHKGNHGKVKPSRWRIEMKGQVDAIEGKVKLELIQIDGYGISLSLPRHIFPSPKSC
jgi:hypothetical protein